MEPRTVYPPYDPDHFATFVDVPDGVRLEVADSRERRRKLILD